MIAIFARVKSEHEEFSLSRGALIGYHDARGRITRIRAAGANSPLSAVSLTHELLMPLIYAMFYPRTCLLRNARMRPIGSAKLFRMPANFSRVSSRSDRGVTGTCVMRRQRTQLSESSRGILLYPCRETRTSRIPVYFGESVWIPATGNTSHIPHQTGSAQTGTYLRSSCAARCS